MIGVLGIIGSNSVKNPPDLGEAAAFLKLSDGRLLVSILPLIKGRGGTAFRVFIAFIEGRQKKMFRLMLGSANPARTLTTVYTNRTPLANLHRCEGQEVTD